RAAAPPGPNSAPGTNPDTPACPATTFALQATPPTTSWSKTFGAASLTPAPGATASTTLRSPAPVVAAARASALDIPATSTTDARAGSTSVVYNVAPDGPPPPTP